MANLTGLQFTVTLGGLPASTFVVVDFELREALNAPFSLAINLASPRPGIDFGAVLDQACELQIWYDGTLQRRISGIVSRFTQGDTGFRRTRYQAEVRPALWRSSLRTNARIFQAKKPDEIISSLLQEAGITDFAFSLRYEHAAREYCVQYRESDLDFINRLAAEEGMYWFHEFEAGKHRVVFADHAAAVEKGEPLFFNLASQSLAHGAFIRRFRYAETVSTAGVELKDYSFKTPAYGLSHKKISNSLDHQREQYEHFDYPGRFKRDPSGKAFTGYRLDALRNGAATGEGESNCAALRPGYSFLLTEHPSLTLNIAWQVVGVVHIGRQPQALEEEGGSEPTTLNNTFSVIAAKTTWRPQLPHKPMVDGPQIAVVTGPEGEEIYCDQYGRIKVQFPWDRYGTRDDQSSCWVRVSQGWAGGQYGMMAIPRVGHEVVVSFLEGDPDQPIVTGRTFHVTNLAPYPLPAGKTRTTLRTQTHKGKGFNELSFEDEAGKENIYVHAQKDIRLEVNNDKSESIGNNHHTYIKNDAYITIDNEYRLLTKKDISLSSQTGFHIKSDNGIYALGNDEIHLSSGNKLVLDAGCELTIQAAGHFIKIDASGISTSAIVNMGSGSPGQGTGWGGKFPVELNSTTPSGPSITMPVESPPSIQKPLCLTCLMAAAENGQALVIRK